MTLEALSQRLAAFNQERDWAKFHTPKAVLLSLTSEVGELAEIYRWVPPELEPTLHLDPVLRAKIEEEVGDIVLNLLLFCQVVGIDPIEAGRKKLEKNGLNYPVQDSHGSHHKRKAGAAQD